MTGNESEIREIDAIIEFIEANPFPEDLEGGRAAIDAMGTPIADDIEVKELDIEGMNCLLLTPPGAASDRALLYLHGGGYVFGSLIGYGGLASEFGRAANCSVLLIDYRLAPEHNFPAPIEDACKAYHWLLNEGYQSSHIAFAGDSAGGGLLMSTMLTLKESGDALPGAGVCICPWLDLKCSGASMHERKEMEPMIQQEALIALAELYMGGQSLDQARVSPLQADLTGLPPLLIQVGEREILFSDAEALAAKAKQDGVDVQFKEWSEMIHVWHLHYPRLKEARDAIQRVGEFLQKIK